MACGSSPVVVCRRTRAAYRAGPSGSASAATVVRAAATYVPFTKSTSRR